MILKLLPLFMLFCILIAGNPLFAQEGTKDSAFISITGYKYAIGLRGGALSGANIKMMIAPQDGIELIVGSGWEHRGVVVVALFERHAAITEKVPGLHLYYGGGAHTGYYLDFPKKNPPPKYDDVVVGGIDGILGLEYFIGEIPFTLGLDIRPTLDIFPELDFTLAGAISVRYAWGQ